MYVYQSIVFLYCTEIHIYLVKYNSLRVSQYVFTLPWSLNASLIRA